MNDVRYSKNNLNKTGQLARECIQSKLTLLLIIGLLLFGILAPQTVAQEITALFKGVSIGNSHEPSVREPEHIILRLPRETREEPKVLNNLYLKNQQQQLISLGQIATLRLDRKQKPIFTKTKFLLFI